MREEGGKGTKVRRVGGDDDDVQESTGDACNSCNSCNSCRSCNSRN